LGVGHETASMGVGVSGWLGSYFERPWPTVNVTSVSP